jgi:hypothetical protein
MGSCCCGLFTCCWWSMRLVCAGNLLSGGGLCLAIDRFAGVSHFDGTVEGKMKGHTFSRL